MKSLSTALEGLRSTYLETLSPATKSRTPQLGSTGDDGRRNTQLTAESRSLQARPPKALPPSIEREIEMARAGQWNLTKFAELVSTSDTLQKQIREELERLDYWMRPATKNEIKTSLAKLILHFPMTSMTEHEKTLLLEDYIAELGRFPAAIIADVCREYCLKLDSQFFPKAGQLIAGCVGKFSVLVKRRKTIASAIEEGQRLKERRLSDKELDAMMAGVREVEIPQPTMEEKIAATIEAMRKAGCPEADIEEFRKGQAA